MITDVCKLTSDLRGTVEALDETEKCAVYCGLNNKQTLQLRLLAEETLGMMRGILSIYDAEFWLETAGKDVALHLRARANMDLSTTERAALLKVSSSGENVAARGFMGKLRQLLESGLLGGAAEFAQTGSLLYTGVDYDTYMLPNEWSLQRYREMLAHTESAKAWDELERSIVASLADDVVVGMRGDVAEITIQKSFQ